MTLGRPRTEDPWTTVGVKMRQSDIERVDALCTRKTISRSTWVRQLVLQHLDEIEQRARKMTDAEAHEYYKDPEHLKPAGPGRKLQRDCTHPKARRSKGGLCMACGANAG